MENSKNERICQSSLTDFMGENVQIPILVNNHKQRLLNKAERYMTESIQLLLESTSRNSIELTRIFAFTVNTLRKMEQEEMCYLKNMAEKKVKISKKYYCCFGLKAWKRCPETFCPVWPNCGEEDCPHSEYIMPEYDPWVGSKI